jgi:hypothetical protein
MKNLWPRQQDSLKMFRLPSCSPIAIGMLTIITHFERAGAQISSQYFSSLWCKSRFSGIELSKPEGETLRGKSAWAG